MSAHPAAFKPISRGPQNGARYGWNIKIEALAKVENEPTVKRYLKAAASAIRSHKIYVGGDVLPFN